MVMDEMPETHNTLRIWEICQLLAQIVEKYIIYDYYSLVVYMECSFKSVWVTNCLY